MIVLNPAMHIVFFHEVQSAIDLGGDETEDQVKSDETQSRDNGYLSSICLSKNRRKVSAIEAAAEETSEVACMTMDAAKLLRQQTHADMHNFDFYNVEDWRDTLGLEGATSSDQSNHLYSRAGIPSSPCDHNSYSDTVLSSSVLSSNQRGNFVGVISNTGDCGGIASDDYQDCFRQHDDVERGCKTSGPPPTDNDLAPACTILPLRLRIGNNSYEKPSRWCLAILAQGLLNRTRCG